MTLRIKDWNTIYENSRTREMKEMQWVPIPNRMDGEGYTALMDHKSGAAHFGVWIALLEIASRCSPRGTLIKNDGTPHNYGSLSRLCRVPAGVIQSAVTRLLSSDIGWLEDCTETAASPHVNGDQPAVDLRPDRSLPAGSPHPTIYAGAERNGMEENGMETHTLRRVRQPVAADDPPKTPVASDRFEEFWARYPNRVGRDDAARVWVSVVSKDAEAYVFAQLGRYEASDQWARGVYKNPAKWLMDGHRSGWRDDPPQPRRLSVSDEDPIAAVMRGAK